MQCFHILTEASFSYKISYSYSARVFTVFCLNLLLSKHLFEITILIAFSLLSLNIKNKLQGSTYLLEVLSSKFILLQPYVGWIRMKICGPTNFSNPQDNRFPADTESKFIVWNYSFSAPTSIYLFKFSNNNSRIKCKIFSQKHQTSFWCLYCWFWIYLTGCSSVFLLALNRWNTLLPYSKFISAFQCRI